MARFYNAITNVISKGGNRRAQRWFLPKIHPGSRVLSVGCGSIGFNADLARACDRVVFLDISANMLEIAKRRIGSERAEGNFEFVCSDIMHYVPPDPFDVILANFFLNTFKWEDCRVVLEHLTRIIHPQGIICIADEAEGTRAWTRQQQRLFRPLITGLHHVWVRHPLHPIYNYAPLLAQFGFHARESHRDPCDYIVSTIYSR